MRPLPPANVEAMRRKPLASGAERDAALLSVLAYAGLQRSCVRRSAPGRDAGAPMVRHSGADDLGRAGGNWFHDQEHEDWRDPVGAAPRALAEDLSRLRLASPSPGELVFLTSRGTVWTDHDWRNWRNRVYRRVVEAVGLPEGRPYDLRHSFASLLIHEGVSVVEVARQMGNAPDVTLGTYAHVFEELDPAERVSAETAVRAAREEFDVRGEYAEGDGGEVVETAEPAPILEADAGTRTPDPISTRADQLSSEDAPSRAKPHGSTGFKPRRWRPKTPNDRGVDPT